MHLEHFIKSVYEFSYFKKHCKLQTLKLILRLDFIYFYFLYKILISALIYTATLFLRFWDTICETLKNKLKSKWKIAFWTTFEKNNSALPLPKVIGHFTATNSAIIVLWKQDAQSTVPSCFIKGSNFQRKSYNFVHFISAYSCFWPLNCFSFIMSF